MFPFTQRLSPNSSHLYLVLEKLDPRSSPTKAGEATSKVTGLECEGNTKEIATSNASAATSTATEQECQGNMKEIATRSDSWELATYEEAEDEFQMVEFDNER